MYLAGDIGGTNTRLAWVAEKDGAFEVRDVAVYPSPSAPGLEPLLARFLAEHPGGQLQGAGFGIAGPVTGRRVRTTNLPWDIEQDLLEACLGVRVALLNDLEAAAHGTLVLPPELTVPLQDGEALAGNRAVIAAGTGLGEALLFRHGERWYPSASEGGHASFAPRDEEEIAIWRYGTARFGHLSYERLVSGAGLALLYEFYRERLRETAPDARVAGVDPAAAVVAAAVRGGDAAAAAALSRFCSIYGAEASNLALKALATGGVYVAGGIAPKVLPFLAHGEFAAGFLDKGRYRDLLARIPVAVIVDDFLGLRGAARAAVEQA